MRLRTSTLGAVAAGLFVALSLLAGLNAADARASNGRGQSRRVARSCPAVSILSTRPPRIACCAHKRPGSSSPSSRQSPIPTRLPRRWQPKYCCRVQRGERVFADCRALIRRGASPCSHERIADMSWAAAVCTALFASPCRRSRLGESLEYIGDEHDQHAVAAEDNSRDHRADRQFTQRVPEIAG